MDSMYSEYERKLIAEKEYDNTLQVDNDIYIETRKSSIGTVRQVIENETGIKVYVVESPDKSEVSVLYEGSKAPFDEGWENQSLWYTISKSVHDIFVK